MLSSKICSVEILVINAVWNLFNFMELTISQTAIFSEKQLTSKQNDSILLVIFGCPIYERIVGFLDTIDNFTEIHYRVRMCDNI